MPEGTLHLPVFYDTLKTLDQTVEVDYYLPGCPPEAENIWTAIVAILEGKLPPKGSVIGVNTTVCDECKRKRNEKKIKKFYRTWQMIPDEETCLLEQGLLCCGIATRAGCKALCPQVNSPCIGCHGPNDGVADYGARLMSAVASVIDSRRSGRRSTGSSKKASPTRSAAFTGSAWPAACCGGRRRMQMQWSVGQFTSPRRFASGPGPRVAGGQLVVRPVHGSAIRWFAYRDQ